MKPFRSRCWEMGINRKQRKWYLEGNFLKLILKVISWKHAGAGETRSSVLSEEEQLGNCCLAQAIWGQGNQPWGQAPSSRLQHFYREQKFEVAIATVGSDTNTIQYLCFPIPTAKESLSSTSPTQPTIAQPVDFGPETEIDELAFWKLEFLHLNISIILANDTYEINNRVPFKHKYHFNFRYLIALNLKFVLSKNILNLFTIYILANILKLIITNILNFIYNIPFSKY